MQQGVGGEVREGKVLLRWHYSKSLKKVRRKNIMEISWTDKFQEKKTTNAKFKVWHIQRIKE